MRTKRGDVLARFTTAIYIGLVDIIRLVSITAVRHAAGTAEQRFEIEGAKERPLIVDAAPDIHSTADH